MIFTRVASAAIKLIRLINLTFENKRFALNQDLLRRFAVIRSSVDFEKRTYLYNGQAIGKSFG